MARRKRKHFTRQTTIHIAGTLGSLAGVIQPVLQYSQYLSNDPMGAIQAIAYHAVENYTGWSLYDNAFHIDSLKNGLIPMAAGLLVSGLASKFGVNRRIAQAGIPFIRI